VFAWILSGLHIYAVNLLDDIMLGGAKH